MKEKELKLPVKKKITSVTLEQEEVDRIEQIKVLSNECLSATFIMRSCIEFALRNKDFLRTLALLGKFNVKDLNHESSDDD